ncbi:hypothetical protein RCO48_10220 [Peribacillus frigoritolerans]|nr:hypothetical protein [Peribacillus frigoritolerans]
MLHKLTFQSLMNKGMKRFGDLPAITLLPSGETITYDELWKKTELITSYLLRLGAGKGRPHSDHHSKQFGKCDVWFGRSSNAGLP